MNPANIKGANKDVKVYVGSSTTLHNLSLFCPHTLCMNYVTNTFLLVSSSVRSKRLLSFVQGKDQKKKDRVVPIKLTQGRREFLFRFCDFLVRCSVYIVCSSVLS